MTNNPTLVNAEFTNFNWLLSLSPLGWTFFFVLFLCYFIRRIKQVPNLYMVPATLVGVLFFMYIGPRWAQYDAGQSAAINCVLGSVVSIIGTLAAWGAHDKALVWLSSKWPAFSFLISDEVKPNQQPKDP